MQDIDRSDDGYFSSMYYLCSLKSVLRNGYPLNYLISICISIRADNRLRVYRVDCEVVDNGHNYLR